jgi:Holliday junction resolvase RusA-like endonuclease
MSYSLTITLPGLPKTTNGSHGHWTAKAAEATKWKNAVCLAVGGQRPLEPLTMAHVYFKRHSSTEPDSDNLAISFKHVRDGLKLARVIVDDKPKHFVAHYSWELAPKSKGFITVRVEGV